MRFLNKKYYKIIIITMLVPITPEVVSVIMQDMRELQ